MGNDQESPLITAIQEAAYAEINHLLSQYSQIDNIEDCLPIMEPDHLRQIVVNAMQRLVEVCLEVMEEIYQDAIQHHFTPEIASFHPSFRMMSDLKTLILGRTTQLEHYIDDYASSFHTFLEKANTYGDEFSNNAQNAGEIGATLGSLLGAWGEVLGSMAGGALAGAATSGEFQEYIQSLCNHFEETVDKVNDQLEKMAERSLDCVIGYNQQLEKFAEAT
jgi:methyl-accepting chemotaxis protein